MTEWKTGDVITADKLNDLESRVGGGIMVVNSTYDESGRHQLDKTWQEIFDAFKAGRCIIHELISTPVGPTETFYRIFHVSSRPVVPSGVQYTIATDATSYNCTSPDGYPVSAALG